MNGSPIDIIDCLLSCFDSARDGETWDRPLHTWLSALAVIETLENQDGERPQLKLAKGFLLACQVIFECWADDGYQPYLDIGRKLVLRARRELLRVEANPPSQGARLTA